MRISVASGKGGTGKTLVAVNLARLLVSRGRQAIYVDTDVEEPNGHLFLNPIIDDETRFTVKIPVLKGNSCSGCGKCGQFCAFNAILGVGNKVIVFDELCHSCGGCLTVCPEQALTWRDKEIGSIRHGHAGDLITLDGLLDVGEARATPLISGVLERVSFDGDVIIDAPPGTSCMAVAAVETADVAVLVTEPTPFGLHDLGLAVTMCRALGVPMRAVINRSDLGNNAVHEFLVAQDIPIIAEIPFDRAVAETSAQGGLIVDELPNMRVVFDSIADSLMEDRP